MAELSAADVGIAVMGGARCTRDVIERKLQAAGELGRGAVISVQVELEQEGEDRDQLLARASAGLPHGKVMVAAISDLYKAGFSLTLYLVDGTSPNHHHVEFGDDVSDQALERFASCFGQPEPNPARRSKT